MRNKKGQGLPLNVIVIAAIVIIVLIVIVAIFIGRMGETSKELEKCRGSCSSNCAAKAPEGKCPADTIPAGLTWTTNTNKECCLIENV